jgi:serine phosphatase RsbU (regulator of sigma subunit)
VLGSFAPHDVLLLYTDGVLEARRDQEEFGLERLEAEFARVAAPRRSAEGRVPPQGMDGHPGASEIAAALAAAARRFAGGKLADDVTLLVLRNVYADAARSEDVCRS